MSTLVLTCWVLVLLIVPPALSIWTSDLPLYRNYLALKAKFFRRNYKRLNRNCFAKITENNSGYPSQTNLQYEDSKPEEPPKCYLTCSDLVQKFTNLVVKFRFFLLAIWAIVIVIALIGISNLEIKSGVPKVFSGDNRLERAIGLRQQNAYVSDEIFYRSNALTRTSTMFREKNFKTTPAQLTLIRSEYVNDPKKTVRRVGWYRRREPVDVDPKMSSREPEKPLSSSRPLVAVILGVKDFSVTHHAFYYKEAQVKITADEQFLQGFSSVLSRDMNNASDVSEDIRESLKSLCHLCNAIANNQELVRDRRAQCLPPLDHILKEYKLGGKFAEMLNKTLDTIEECRQIPKTKIVSKDLAVGSIGSLNNKYPGYLIFVFESTLSPDHSAWEARDHFVHWQLYLHLMANFASPPIRHVHFASDVFDAAFMEIVARMGALYSMGVALSAVVLVLALFTAFWTYLGIIMATVVSCVSCIFGCFHYLGVEPGAAEMVVASILIGNTADYVFHLVESYSTFSRRNIALQAETNNHTSPSESELRRQNCESAMRRIGLSIIGSSLTTALGCVPLTFAGLHALKVLGTLIIISSLCALVFTLLFALPMLAICGPVGAKATPVRRVVVFSMVGAVIATMLAILFVLDNTGLITVYNTEGL